MKTIRLLTVVACLFASESARANHGEPHPPQFPQEQNVYTAFSVPPTPGENVYETFFPSIVVPGHRKIVYTASNYFNLMSTEPANVTFWFAWQDTVTGQGPVHLSDPFTVNIGPGGQADLITPTYVIPYTPPAMGIRLQNNGPGGPIQAIGGLIWQTIPPIPEPSALALAAIAGAGMLARRGGVADSQFRLPRWRVSVRLNGMRTIPTETA
jgi:hypothetical protein